MCESDRDYFGHRHYEIGEGYVVSADGHQISQCVSGLDHIVKRREIHGSWSVWTIVLGRGGLDQQGHIGGAGCRHLRAAYSPSPRTVRLLMQQAVQQQAAVPFAACASCRCNHPGYDGHCCGVDVRQREFRPAASDAERDTRSNPDFMWRIRSNISWCASSWRTGEVMESKATHQRQAVQPGLASLSHRGASRGTR